MPVQSTGRTRPMGYKTDCVECGKRGIVPDSEESVVGVRMYRTITDEYETWNIKHIKGEAGTHPDDAPISKWKHYCPEHAEEIGIV